MTDTTTVTFRAPVSNTRRRGKRDTTGDPPDWDQTGGGATNRPAPRTARGWLHAIHPDTGQAVVFQAGELLPDWAPDPED